MKKELSIQVTVRVIIYSV